MPTEQAQQSSTYLKASDAVSSDEIKPLCTPHSPARTAAFTHLKASGCCPIRGPARNPPCDPPATAKRFGSVMPAFVDRCTEKLSERVYLCTEKLSECVYLCTEKLSECVYLCTCLKGKCMFGESKPPCHSQALWGL